MLKELHSKASFCQEQGSVKAVAFLLGDEGNRSAEGEGKLALHAWPAQTLVLGVEGRCEQPQDMDF